MRNKRLWIALLAIPICLISIILVGAQRSRQADAGGVIDPTCTSSSPCIEYDNNGSGPGIRGISVGGNGLAGATKFNSTSLVNSREGLIGNDVSTSGSFNAGVRGLSVRGFGVSGQSTSGTGVSGISTSGVGVTATSTSGAGVIATSTNLEGLDAVSTNFDGVVGRTFNPSKTSGIGVAGVDGLDSSTDGGLLNSGVLGTSTNGIGVAAASSNYIGANVVGGNGPAGFPAISIVSNPGASDLIDACLSGTVNPCDANHSVFRVQSGPGTNVGISTGGILFLGDTSVNGGLDVGFVSVHACGGCINITGQYQKNGGCLIGCTLATTTSPGRSVVSYVATQSLPTIDDFGEASLQNGSAYVRLDPAFANVIDQRATYLVFITPEGDSRGLYVTDKSIRGFAVHENMGGHSSLAFSYRIVAKPLGKQEQRLPMVTVPKIARPAPPSRFHVPSVSGKVALQIPGQ